MKWYKEAWKIEGHPEVSRACDKTNNGVCSKCCLYGFRQCLQECDIPHIIFLQLFSSWQRIDYGLRRVEEEEKLCPELWIEKEEFRLMWLQMLY